ncbi:hypothetical protein BG004_007222 [Podila humilis]|nr:hypothetical protein BG004_007222 [Podila humilis]
MAMTEQHTHEPYFQSTHARVDSKFHSDTSSSEKIDESCYIPSNRPLGSSSGGGGGLRRCAATRDLTSIGDSVNYCARVSVEYLTGKPDFPFQQSSWHPLSTSNCTSEDVLVDNFETVNRFKKSLLTRLYPTSEGLEDEETWPSTTLFCRRQRQPQQQEQQQQTCSSSNQQLEALDGDEEAMYMHALKDGDQIVLLVHETSASPVLDPVALWVESIRAQKEFVSVDS